MITQNNLGEWEVGCDYCGESLLREEYLPSGWKDYASKKGWVIEGGTCICKDCHDILTKPAAMISLPMRGKSEEEIQDAISKAYEYLDGQGYIVRGTWFEDYRDIHDIHERLSVYRSFPSNVPLRYLAKSIKVMAFCKAVYFCKGWEDARGCAVEHEAAKQYGLTILYESEI